MKSVLNLYFITKNTKGIRYSIKRLKLFEYFKSKIVTHKILFLPETNSNREDE